MDALTDANPRAIAGDNLPPETPLTDRLAAFYAVPAILERNAALVKEVGDLETEAAKIAAVDDDAGNDAAAAVVVKIKKLAPKCDAAFTAEKAPVLAAGRNCDAFKKHLNDDKAATSLDAQKKRIERLIGAWGQKKAAAAAERLRLAAEAQRKEADRRAEEARQAEALNSPKLAEAVLAEAVKSEKMADRMEKMAEGPFNDLARSATAGGATTGVRSNWAVRIVDDVAFMRTLGPLGPYINPDVLATAARAYRRAEEVAGRVAEVPGLEFFKDYTGAVRG